MARKARLFVPGAIYHVYCRTARGECVFSEEAEARTFVSTVRKICEQDSVTVLAWCLMSNHYHLVLRTGQVLLWSSMARIQSQVARRFNRRHGYLGRLWQSRYKARYVDSERYFRQAVAYVHLNPVAAGLAEDPAAYEYSGHAALIGRRRPRLVNAAAALRAYGTSPRDARQSYLASVRAVAEARWLDHSVSRLPWWVAAKRPDGIVDPDEDPKALRYDGQREPPERPRINAEDLLERFAECSGVSRQMLAGAGRTPEVVMARTLFTAAAVLEFGLAVNEVSECLHKNRGTISRWLGTARTLRRQDLEFAAQLSRLVESVCELHNATK